jgi:predicted transcriptional regulator
MDYNAGKSFTLRLDDEIRERIGRITKVRSSAKYGDWPLGHSRSLTRLIVRGLEVLERKHKITDVPVVEETGQVPRDTSIRLSVAVVDRLDRLVKVSSTDDAHQSIQSVLRSLLLAGLEKEEKKLEVLENKK